MTTAESVALWVCLALLLLVINWLYGVFHGINKLGQELAQLRAQMESTQALICRTSDHTRDRVDALHTRMFGDVEDDDPGR
jgi:hypothetical protein